MKAALITEEQIKAIEDALETGEPLNDALYENALAIVKQLKVSDPAVWRYMPSTFMSGFVLTDDPSRVDVVKRFGDKFILEGLYSMVQS